MIELIMVIIVLGILAAVALPRLGRDLRQSAADNVLSAIRYTQHLALTDSKENKRVVNNTNWQSALWQMRFNNYGGEWVYSVWSNDDFDNNVDANEPAIDPANGKLLHSANAVMDGDESPNIFLTRNFAINNVGFNGCVNTGPNAPNVAGGSRHIAFDYLGRPHRGVTVAGSNDSRTAITSNPGCIITFTLQTGENFQIQIENETGYAHIVNQNAS